MKNRNVRMLTEAGVMLAAAQILSYAKIFEMPSGGSVTAGSMVPIILFAVRWGSGYGFLVGAIYGVLQFILGPKYSFHPVSLLLDYPVPFGLLGMFSGMFGRKVKGIFMGVLAGLFGRFVCHVISGVVVFSSYAGNQNPWVYSIIYNASYLVPELIISFIFVTLLIKYAPYLKESNDVQ